MVEGAGDEPVDRMGQRQDGITHPIKILSSSCGRTQQSVPSLSFSTSWRTGSGPD